MKTLKKNAEKIISPNWGHTRWGGQDGKWSHFPPFFLEPFPKSSLHSEKVKICKYDCEFFNITQNKKYWPKNNWKISSITWFLLKKNP